jgi:hypothetical protein
MSDGDEWCRETDDILFSEGGAYSRAPRFEAAGESSRAEGDIAIDAVDAALFGPAASGTSAATDVEQRFAMPDGTAPVEMEPPAVETPTTTPVRMRFGAVPGDADLELPEADEPTAPVPIPVPVRFDEDATDLVAPPPAEERDASRAADNDHGRRRWMVAGLTLAVAIGASLGAVVLTRSSASRPSVDTGSESTTTTPTTTSTTTVATTTPPTPETSVPGPAASPAATATPRPRPAPTTTVPTARPPGTAETNTTVPGPAPPSATLPAPAPESAPPSTSPPSTSPPSTAPPSTSSLSELTTQP